MFISVSIRWDLVFTTFDPHYYYLWIWLAAGLTGAILSFRYWDFGVTLTGAFGGFALAMGIIAAANLAITNAGRYIIMGLLIIAGSAIATFFDRVFIILATSFGGAYLFMFGVDEFTQVGYREMIVIFDFTGKTLTYLPSVGVYIMLGSSLVLAGLGIAWEFWHHETPLLMDRKAVFRIYGRPFGKRPKRLVGQRIHYRLKTKSDLYIYITSCVCLQRWTIDDVLYNDEVPDTHIPEAAQNPVTDTQQAIPQNGEVTEQKPQPLTEEADVPLKSAPMLEGVHLHDSVNIDQPQNSESTSHNDHKLDHTISTPIPIEHHEHTEASEIEHSTHIETTTSEQKDNFETSTSESHRIQSSEPHPHHPLFSPHIGEHTMDMLDLVAGDDEQQGTIPRDLRSRDRRVISTAFLNPALSVPTSADTVSHIFMQGLHMLEVSESSQESCEVTESLPDTQDERSDQ
ncbi:hypothetical protein BGZ76_007115 [Entomortierella beljakovae]|nr:hypothetical protein BGZ76_007115 [Entomortierella beljakovae]